MASHLYVNGLSGLLSPAGIRTYRQFGVVVARQFLSERDTAALAEACREVAVSRGPRVFPGLDEAHSGGIEIHPKGVSPARSDLSSKTPPPDVAARLRARDASGLVERRYQRVHLKCRDGRQVDRVYRRLAARRERYMRWKHVPNYATPAEEASGRMSAARQRELGEAHQYADVRRSFEAYRASGAMEREVRRDHHIDRVLEHLQGWAKCWCRLWPESGAMRALLAGSLGRGVGEAAAALGGDVVVRLFDDAAHDHLAMLNGTTFNFVGGAANFRGAASMTASIGLRPVGGTAGPVVLPGSHRVLLEETDGGKNTAALLAAAPSSAAFDAGKAVRHLTGLREVPIVQLPPLEPGSVMFMHHYTVSAAPPEMSGAAVDYAPPSNCAVMGPHQYVMMLMPDRCVFDGKRNSWAAKDSHGPLYNYEAGQLLVDDAIFPVLHRALDIE